MSVVLTRPGGVPTLRVTRAQVEAVFARLRALLMSGSVGKRRAVLSAWVKRIEVDGTELKIGCTFPWCPDGNASPRPRSDSS